MSSQKAILRALSIGLSAGLLSIVPVSRARAGQWNKQTRVTFSAPVEIPGRVLLPGTYTFQLLNNPSDRDIVQIFNKHRTKLDATVLAIPTYRMKPTGRTVVTFSERPVGTPLAIRTWFYPGDEYGQRFLYPRSHLGMPLTRTRSHSPKG